MRQEQAEGLTALLDPKVITRLINTLEKSGQIKTIKSIVKVGAREKKVTHDGFSVKKGIWVEAVRL